MSSMPRPNDGMEDMRALLGLLCLFCGAPAAMAGAEASRLARTAEYRAVLSEIAAARAVPDEPLSHDLPDGLREAVEAWTEL